MRTCVRADRRSCEATILHADLDAFFASVEQRDDPSLRGRPVIVGGGVVLAASYEAKACGVRTAMGGRQALRLCPRRRGRRAAHVGVHRREQGGVRGLPGHHAAGRGAVRRRGVPRRGRAAAAARFAPWTSPRDLRGAVRERVGLPITVGVARTKFLAKVASAVGKPDGLLGRRPSREREFLHPLPVERLWGVGMVTSAQPAPARHHDGRATSPRCPSRTGVHARPAVGPAPARAGPLPRPAAGPPGGGAARSAPSRRSGGRRSRRPRSTRCSSRSSTGSPGGCAPPSASGARSPCGSASPTSPRATRSHTMSLPTADTDAVLTTARVLLRVGRCRWSGSGPDDAGLAVSNLDDGDAIQLTLPFDPPRASALDAAVDGARDRFGTRALTRAVLLGRDHGPSVPLLPD